MRLSEDAPIDVDVYTAHLPTDQEDQLVGMKVQAGSWGNLEVNGESDPKITIFETKVVGHTECEFLWSEEISQSFICTGVQNETGLANGDSGGIASNIFQLFTNISYNF